MTTWAPNWSVFEAFPKPRGAMEAWRPTWSAAVDEWLVRVRAQANRESVSIQSQLALWDEALSVFGGDPARCDWGRFRPLRLSREEDWSDWLAFLLGEPEGHPVARRLFPPATPATRVEDIRREEPVGFGRRADLVLFWDGGRASHVEVKVWDGAFEKTVETGRGCREKFRERRDWIDHVLLPEESEEDWLETEAAGSVTKVSWTQVARELRRQLFALRSGSQWAAFARVFVGAVEQKILGLPPFPTSGETGAATSAVFRFGRLLREALEHGQPD